MCAKLVERLPFDATGIAEPDALHVGHFPARGKPQSLLLRDRTQDRAPVRAAHVP